MSSDFLLINNNNTRTKFALAGGKNGSITPELALTSAGLTTKDIRKLVGDWEYCGVVLSSVVPDNVPTITAAFPDTKIVSVAHNIELGIEIDFPNPDTVGADRIANAVAVGSEARNNKPVIVVDFGTAVTFDIVDTRPAYVGGVIAPGLDAMRSYLHQKTALLPLIDIRKPDSAVGRSTEEAMLSGAYHGYRGLVKEIISQIEKELGEDAQILATGGYAELIAKGLPEIDSVDPLLTMRGLQKIALLHFPES